MQQQNQNYKSKHDFYLNFLLKLNDKILFSCTNERFEELDNTLIERKNLIEEIKLKKIEFNEECQQKIIESFNLTIDKLNNLSKKTKEEIYKIKVTKKVIKHYSLGNTEK